ncbi:MAG: septum formation initiator family protein [Clostridia bacterium]
MKKKILGILMFLGKIAFCSYIVYVLVSQQPIIDAKKQQKQDLLIQLEDAKRIETRLRKDLEIADTQEYIERMAREKLGFLKPDERIFIDIRK